jgi:hypothetical protein
MPLRKGSSKNRTGSNVDLLLPAPVLASGSTVHSTGDI